MGGGRLVTAVVLLAPWPWKRHEALLSGNISIQLTGIYLSKA